MSDQSTTAMEPGASAHEDHAHDEKHLHPDSHYTTIFVALVVLAGISFVGPWVGEALELSVITLITAFGIAVVKAWLVMKHFMHLDVEKPIVHYFLVTSVVFMVLFFAGVAPDVGNHEGKNWENLAAKAYIAKTQEEQAAGGDHHGGHGDNHGDDHGHDDHDKDTKSGDH
ncbi:MAG: cytochrome C oxidase subunit IV family protein [Myxococcota bacterium]